MSVDVTLSCEIKIKLAQAPYHTSCGKSDALPKIFANSQGYHGYLCFHIPPFYKLETLYEVRECSETGMFKELGCLLEMVTQFTKTY